METTVKLPTLPTLLTFEEVADLLRLGRTAARERLAKSDAPSPIRLNKRVYRWDADEVAAWLDTLRAPVLPLHMPEPRPAATKRSGRPRQHWA